MPSLVSRRDFLAGSLGLASSSLTLRLPVGGRAPAPARLAVISDLHHGLAPDALERFDIFLAAVAERDVDAVWQLGDFCYSDDGSAECLRRWHAVTKPRYNVLGNHDMDRVDKAAALTAWKMPARYYAVVLSGWRFVVLDLNHFRKDGALHAYANGNYFTDGASHNWADPEQILWLDKELRGSREPVILVSHQPVGLGARSGQLPEEQRQILDLVSAAGRANPAGRVACCLSGHLHVDRIEWNDGLPSICVNSASYFWSAGMRKYTAPLFAFLEFGSDGTLQITGRDAAFVERPPPDSDGVLGRSASIASRRITLPTT